MKKLKLLLLNLLLLFTVITPNTVLAEDSQTYNVFYKAALADSKNPLSNIPSELEEAMPEDVMGVNNNEIITPTNPSSTSINGYTFVGYEPGLAVIEDCDITFYGLWVKDNGTNTNSNSGISTFAARAVAAELYAGFSGATWQLKGGTYQGSHPLQLGGQPVYCIDIIRSIPGVGEKYTLTGKQYNKCAEIIMAGLAHGMEQDAIQAAVWNYLWGYIKYTAGSKIVDPNHSVYQLPNYNCYIYAYEPVSGASQTYAIAGGSDPKEGTLSLKKVCSTDINYADKCPGTYSLAGAVYGVYSDENCTNQIGTLTTTTNGTSNKLSFNTATNVWVKELTPSPGFKLDLQVYGVRVNVGDNKVITSKEVPYDDPVYIELVKNPSNPLSYIKYLDTAEFTVRYYDEYSSTIPTLAPKYEWTFKPIISQYTGLPTVLLDMEHYISGDTSMFDDSGSLKIPLGTFTIEETKAPQTYARDENIYLGHVTLEDGEVKVEVEGGEYLTVINDTQLVQLEKSLILNTTAWFKDYDKYIGDKHTYVADGNTTIIDTITYENLEIDEYIIKGKVVEKIFNYDYYTQTDYNNDLCSLEQVGTIKQYTQEDYESGLCAQSDIGKKIVLSISEGTTIATSNITFTPTDDGTGFGSGSIDIPFDINADNYPNMDFVVYEYIYKTSDENTLITYHEDIFDLDQCIRIDPLYRAGFCLYKVSNGASNIKLNGAVFEVKTSRTKRDGSIIQENLGRLMTGGIYAEDSSAFILEVTNDPSVFGLPSTTLPTPETIISRAYNSSYDQKLGVHNAKALDLPDGIYLARTSTNPTVKKIYVAEGTVYLADQPEDTKVTIKEIIAPHGYYLDSNEYSYSIGHNYTLERIENYRSNIKAS